MRILLCGNTNKPYSAEALISKNLKEIGHKVTELIYPTHLGRYEHLNKELKNQINVLKPDLVIVGKVMGLKYEDIISIKKEYGVKIVQWVFDAFKDFNIDDNFDQPRFDKWFDQTKAFDVTLGAEGHLVDYYRNHGINYYLLREGVDTDFHTMLKPLPEYGKNEADVMFAGYVYNQHRVDLLTKLVNIPNIKVRHHKNTYLRKLSEACSVTKIAVNTNFRNDLGSYWSARNYEIPACGICTLAGYVTDLAKEFKDGRDVVFWHSFDDLREKVVMLMGNPDLRKKIALGGFKQAQNHTWKKRLDKMFRILKFEGIA